MYLSIHSSAAFAILSVMLFLNFIVRWMTTAPLLLPIVSAKSQPVLRLNENNKFHIAIFSDLHYGEEEHGWGVDQDVNSTRVMNDILDYEDPDFVIISLPLYQTRTVFLI